MILRKLLNHTEPVSSSKNEVNNGNLTGLIWTLNESKCVKYLT